MDLQHDEYKRIYKELGLTPKQWHRLQKLNEGAQKGWNSQIDIYKCRCRSPWCKGCAKSSPTNATITARLGLLDWSKVRHVILTVDRSVPPEITYTGIRANKSIPRLCRALKMQECRWLWVLEFHRGGFPHWHLLIESDRGMIGKKLIESKWKHGLVWESYIKSGGHWNAIKGYHKSKGYLAGEQKAHQLELPAFLLGQSRVRKFGTNIALDNVPRGTIATKTRNKPTRRAAQSYERRFKECDTRSKAVINGRWIDVNCGGTALKDMLEHCTDPVDWRTLHGDYDAVFAVIDGINNQVDGGTDPGS